MVGGTRVVGSDSVVIADLVVRRRRRPVLRGVSCSFGPGVTVLAGANGAGKSTLLSVLATVLRSDGGRVAVAGHDVGSWRGASAARRELGYLPQDPAFPGTWTVAEALQYAAWLHRVPRDRRDAAVERCSAQVGVGHEMGTPLRKLSGGTRQRALLGQALVHDPPVLLLDEPTVGVGAEHRVELRHTIAALAADRCVLMSSHLTEDVELLADRVVLLHEGVVRFDGSPDVLRSVGNDAGDDERAVELALRRLADEAP